jgi:hypothetical protein
LGFRSTDKHNPFLYDGAIDVVVDQFQTFT